MATKTSTVRGRSGATTSYSGLLNGVFRVVASFAASAPGSDETRKLFNIVTAPRVLYAKHAFGGGPLGGTDSSSFINLRT